MDKFSLVPKSVNSTNTIDYVQPTSAPSNKHNSIEKKIKQREEDAAWDSLVTGNKDAEMDAGFNQINTNRLFEKFQRGNRF